MTLMSPPSFQKLYCHSSLNSMGFGLYNSNSNLWTEWKSALKFWQAIFMLLITSGTTNPEFISRGDWSWLQSCVWCSGFPSSWRSMDRTRRCSGGRYFIPSYSGRYRAIPHFKPTAGRQTWTTVHLCSFKLFGEGSSHALPFAPQSREVNRKELFLAPCAASCSGIGYQAAFGSGCGSLGNQEEV